VISVAVVVYYISLILLPAPEPRPISRTETSMYCPQPDINERQS
jgi:hypothetical protein